MADQGKGRGGRGWPGILLYGDQSSRMVSTFPSTTMPRELYAIRRTKARTGNRIRGEKSMGERKKEREVEGRTDTHGSVPEKLFKCVK